MRRIKSENPLQYLETGAILSMLYVNLIESG